MEDAQQNGRQDGVQIVVNGRPHTVTAEEISFEQVVALAFPAPSGPNTVFTVTYRNGPESHPQGTMIPNGRVVKIKNGMIFNVTSTDKS